MLTTLAIANCGPGQQRLLSHSARLLSALQQDERCNAIQLSKDFGETVVHEQGLLDRPSWHWPER